MAKAQEAFEWRLMTDQALIGKARSALYKAELTTIRNFYDSDLYSFAVEDLAIKLMYQTMSNLGDEAQNALLRDPMVLPSNDFLEAMVNQVIRSVTHPNIEMALTPVMYADNYYGRKHLVAMKSHLERSGKYSFQDVEGEKGIKRAVFIP